MFHRVNHELNKDHTKNVLQIIWTIPVLLEATTFEFQFYNNLKLPINWALKYNKCITCTERNSINSNNDNQNDNITDNIKKSYGTHSNKCVHYKCIKISPTMNLKVINLKLKYI